jgi:hypothetical protein
MRWLERPVKDEQSATVYTVACVGVIRWVVCIALLARGCAVAEALADCAHTPVQSCCCLTA